jgi:carbonic anhydrase
MRRILLTLILCGCPPPPPVHWSYGEKWDGVCATGKRQSPVDLRSGGSFAPRIQLEYWPTPMRVMNNGHTIELEYDAGSFLVLDGKRYALKQFHFHHPSEHHLDGKSFPLEVHFVHKSEDGKLAVVGVPIAEGAANKWLQPAWTDLPQPGEHREPEARINAADLVTSKPYLHYSGSLTTPPCSEGVEWFEMTTPIEMSAEQIAAFAKMFPDNHREPQPLGDRHVEAGEIR